MKQLSLVFTAFAILLLPAGPSAADETADSVGTTYQIVKATDNRVWRLNTRTGEVAVCSLDANGATLVCSTSSEAATPPAKDFATLEAERRAVQAEAKAEREAELARDLAFLERVVESLKSLIRAAMEHDQASAKP